MHKKMIEVVKDSFLGYLNANCFIFSKEIDGGAIKLLAVIDLDILNI
jgi:hypothetical protein